MFFLKAQNRLVAGSAIAHADFSAIESLVVTLTTHTGEVFVAENIDAIEAALHLKPSVLESKRLRWKKHMWAVHNLIGHPLMQLLAWCGAYRWAFWVHDATVPRPSGRKEPTTKDIR